MRCSYKTLVFTIVAVAQTTLGYWALAGELEPRPSSTFEIAQASAATLETPLAELLTRAQALSASGRFLEAYELLANAENAYIGVIEFDYALGRAALDAGRPDKATLAFSRVLALDPTHAGALIDTGRGYLALGNFAQARATFEGLLALDPPPPVRAQLQAYLEQASRGQAQGAPTGGPSWRGYLATMVGGSTNVNQSPAQSQVFVPAFGATLELSNQNVKKADGFAGILGGVEASQPLDSTYSMVVGGEFVERRNFHETQFDLGGANLYLGLDAAWGEHVWRLQRIAGRDYLGDSPSRDLDALTLNYLGPLVTDTQLLGFAQEGRLRGVPEDLKIFDANFVNFGVGVSRKVAKESTAFVVFSTGDQKDVGGNPSGDKRLLGLRLGGETAIHPRLKLTGSVTWESGQYDKVDPSFLVERRDLRRYYEAVLQYAFDPRTSLRFGFAHTDQRSNVAVYEYDRNEWWAMLRYEF
jgi:tetratricopeptide (TPR) repeat protein